mmetsp:Transcript_53654/g.154673  ORF Transcript_53654/g.154673 Transcript_53654/m.154673 type:complete len:263 (-) Transcript_53654:4099-4887(-)
MEGGVEEECRPGRAPGGRLAAGEVGLGCRAVLAQHFGVRLLRRLRVRRAGGRDVVARRLPRHGAPWRARRRGCLADAPADSGGDIRVARRRYGRGLLRHGPFRLLPAARAPVRRVARQHRAVVVVARLAAGRGRRLAPHLPLAGDHWSKVCYHPRGGGTRRPRQVSCAFEGAEKRRLGSLRKPMHGEVRPHLFPCECGDGSRRGEQLRYSRRELEHSGRRDQALRLHADEPLPQGSQGGQGGSERIADARSGEDLGEAETDL